MERKTIVMCVTSYDEECETLIVEGVRKRCAEDNINLLVFHPLMRKPNLAENDTPNISIIDGENEIFNLINYDKTDGIILLGENFLDSKMPDRIILEATKRKIPTININDDSHIAMCNINLSDVNAMELIVRHLVEVHGLRTINFVGGFPGNPQTEERLDAYKRVLTEHGIPVEEERIGYGQFWTPASDVTAEFMKAEKKPEAIVYASDTMAMFGLDCLKSLGYRVPEDVAITGFDGVKDIYISEPAITSAKRDFTGAGERAVEVLEKVFDGEDIPDTVDVDAKLIINRSCGCNPDNAKDAVGFLKRKYSSIWNFQFFNFNLQKMNMLFANASNSIDIYTTVDEWADFFKIKRMFFCICDNLEIDPEMSSDSLSNEGIYGLTKNMVSMSGFGHDIESRTTFPTENYLPIDILNNEKPCFALFSPMYFKDRFLGYVSIEQDSVITDVGDLYGTWVMQLANNVGSYYMKNELMFVLKKLDDLYTKDTLTGLYNRRGMEKEKYVILDAIEDKLLFTCIVSDVDNLKIVNDKYGHEGGDEVISAVAKAISQAFPENSVNIRTGGDEFLSFFPHVDDLNVDELLMKLQLKLDAFNLNSGLPYKAGCSCGYVTRTLTSMEDFEQMKSVADEKMYAEKRRKKTLRE
ncbi:MAG: GGDEF domain-containing protein [Lachnospiraceae bacterium]|nr:GGDEF domain-containing protein [Lachnospiraceae bacterium]